MGKQLMNFRLEALSNQVKKCLHRFLIKNRNCFIVITIFCFTGCSAQSQKQLTFYVSNIEENERNVRLKIIVDDSIFIDQDFVYSRVVPNYQPFTFKLNKGVYHFDVIKNDVSLLKDTFNLKQNTFIYLSYGKENGRGEKIYLKKTTIDYKQH